MKPLRAVVCVALACSSLGAPVYAYPTDPEAQKLTEIRRLKWQQDINEGKVRGRRIPEGAQWPLSAVKLRMLQNPNFDVTPETPTYDPLQKGLEELVDRWRFRRYSIAILDITDPLAPRYAAINPTAQQTPGSAAKPLLAAGMFHWLKQRFPNSVDKRRELLKSVKVKADNWAMPNHHEVPVVAGDVTTSDYRVSIRAVRTGDAFSLYEWMDNALSPSSNASASMLWREATLMGLLGDAYPPAKYDGELFNQWDKEAFTQAAFNTVDAPLKEAGLNVDDFHIRLFFTRGAGRHIKGGASRASPLGMLRWMLRVEQGRMVDAFSSLELKRMLYLTRRRIRYAKASALNRSATFFKTGSLYRCQPEEGYSCAAYEGNAVNVLNAFIVVETPPDPAPEPAAESTGKPSRQATREPTAKSPATDQAAPEPAAKSGEAAMDAPQVNPPPEPELIYIVAVMSNELKRNAATDHERLGGEIHQLIKRTHAPVTAEAAGR